MRHFLGKFKNRAEILLGTSNCNVLANDSSLVGGCRSVSPISPVGMLLVSYYHFYLPLLLLLNEPVVLLLLIVLLLLRLRLRGVWVWRLVLLPTLCRSPIARSVHNWGSSRVGTHSTNSSQEQQNQNTPCPCPPPPSSHHRTSTPKRAPSPRVE